ncbi:hypothetical protein Aconfl_35300 [Algoriphagus confluentis]|uniref:Uncharacterized protein n=1 Tax=Algoriphagus confluentis TaxID=1697556 RepID=A0ABQ6PSI2_9BACT|nr:hypothetical protein Aconfl_35300 [Algoriphagus confluentis]
MKVLLIIYFIFYVLFYFFIDYVVLNDLVLYEFYSDKFSESRVYELLDFRKEWLWVTYPIKLLIQLIALQIPAMLIYLGLYLAKYEISYRKVFGIVLISEFIFFIPLLIKIIWFSFHPVSMESVRLFAPLSLFSLFDAESLQEWLFYPFKVLNVFEVVYWILMAFLLAKYCSFRSKVGLVRLRF